MIFYGEVEFDIASRFQGQASEVRHQAVIGNKPDAADRPAFHEYFADHWRSMGVPFARRAEFEEAGPGQTRVLAPFPRCWQANPNRCLRRGFRNNEVGVRVLHQLHFDHSVLAAPPALAEFS